MENLELGKDHKTVCHTNGRKRLTQIRQLVLIRIDFFGSFDELHK